MFLRRLLKAFKKPILKQQFCKLSTKKEADHANWSTIHFKKDYYLPLGILKDIEEVVPRQKNGSVVKFGDPICNLKFKTEIQQFTSNKVICSEYEGLIENINTKDLRWKFSKGRKPLYTVRQTLNVNNNQIKPSNNQIKPSDPELFWGSVLEILSVMFATGMILLFFYHPLSFICLTLGILIAIIL